MTLRMTGVRAFRDYCIVKVEHDDDVRRYTRDVFFVALVLFVFVTKAHNEDLCEGRKGGISSKMGDYD